MGTGVIFGRRNSSIFHSNHGSWTTCLPYLFVISKETGKGMPQIAGYQENIDWLQWRNLRSSANLSALVFDSMSAMAWKDPVYPLTTPSNSIYWSPLRSYIVMAGTLFYYFLDGRGYKMTLKKGMCDDLLTKLNPERSHFSFDLRCPYSEKGIDVF